MLYLLLMGTTFCITFVRSGKDWWGVIWAIITVVLLVGFYFFNGHISGTRKKEIITPLLSAWIPNLIYLIPCAGILLHNGFRDEYNHHVFSKAKRLKHIELGKTLVLELYHDAFDHFKKSIAINPDVAIDILTYLYKKNTAKRPRRHSVNHGQNIH